MTILAALQIDTHDGTEFAFGRKGNKLALLLPAGATVADGLERFRSNLSSEEIAALTSAA